MAPGISTLPPELLTRILFLAAGSALGTYRSTQELLVTSLVSKQFRDISQALLWRCIDFGLATPTKARRLEASGLVGVWRTVEVTFRGSNWDDSVEDARKILGMLFGVKSLTIRNFAKLDLSRLLESSALADLTSLCLAYNDLALPRHPPQVPFTLSTLTCIHNTNLYRNFPYLAHGDLPLELKLSLKAEDSCSLASYFNLVASRLHSFDLYTTLYDDLDDPLFEAPNLKHLTMRKWHLLPTAFALFPTLDSLTVAAYPTPDSDDAAVGLSRQLATSSSLKKLSFEFENEWVGQRKEWVALSKEAARRKVDVVFGW